jgi:hypothetical protein
MKTDENLLHIGAEVIFSFTCIREFDSSSKSAVYIEFFLFVNYIV